MVYQTEKQLKEFADKVGAGTPVQACSSVAVAVRGAEDYASERDPCSRPPQGPWPPHTHEPTRPLTPPDARHALTLLLLLRASPHLMPAQVPADVKDKLQGKVDALKEAIPSDDLAKIKVRGPVGVFWRAECGAEQRPK